jgi:hypothetical protein
VLHPKPITPLFRSSFILQKTLFVAFRFSPPKLVFVLSPDKPITLFSKPNFLIACRALWERISAVSPVISTKSKSFVLI